MKPKANGDNGDRGEDGRFLPGNPGGPGNPYCRQVASLRQAILNAVTPQDVAEIIQAQVQQAKNGDTVAAKFILERLLGRPLAVDLALVAIKAGIEERRVEENEELNNWLKGLKF